MRFCYLVAKQIIRIMRLNVPLVLACTEMAKKIRPFKGDWTAAHKLRFGGGKTREGNPPKTWRHKGTQGAMP